jgi:hypothetical protein
MGFLNSDFPTSTVIIDAVLTDLGRQFISRGDGSFAITRWTASDDEIDYNLWNPANPGAEDAAILVSPVFEGFINESFALKYPAMSCDIPNLKYLPKIVTEPTTVTKYYRDAIKNSFVVTVSQKMITNDVASIPSQIWDPSFIVQVDDDLLICDKVDLVNISAYNIGSYIAPTNSTQITNVNSCNVYFRSREVTSEQWSSYANSGTVAPNRQITTLAKFTGTTSGLHTTIAITLTESSS